VNKRFALCVGNNYPGTGFDLNGCVNDANDWAELLAREGYNVELLLEANKRQVLDALNALVGTVGFGDRIVFTSSGHGTWIPDGNGDESDGRDEALVMAGLSRYDLLVDDEIEDVFSKLPYGSRVLILSDSCHSGTVSRFMPEAQFGDAHQARFPGERRFISPIELNIPISYERAVEIEQLPASRSRTGGVSLISGCADSEYSWDSWFDERANGAFTRAAIDNYMPRVSLGRWFSRIRSVLPAPHLFPQTPQLTTTTYRKYTRAL
jgi:hypothetical protein